MDTLKTIGEIVWILGIGAALIVALRNKTPRKDNERISGDW